MKTLLTILATILLLSGMALTQTKNEKEITVAIGASKSIPETTLEIKFVEVLEDSRCPEGVNCIWAGNARIRIEVSKDGKNPKAFELDTNGPTASIDFECFRIALKSVAPYPKADKPTDRANYKATFVVIDLKTN
jgi:hypothetical protein